MGEHGEEADAMDRCGDQRVVEYQNPWFRVLRDGRFYFVDEPKARNAAVVFVEFEGQLVLIEQYRVAAGCTLLATPRGYGEAHETSVACAAREAFEETGYRVPEEALQFLGQVRPNSAILTSLVDVYFGRATEKVGQFTDTDEVSTVKLLTYEEFEARIAEGGVTDGITLAGYLLCRLRGGLRQ